MGECKEASQRATPVKIFGLGSVGVREKILKDVRAIALLITVNRDKKLLQPTIIKNLLTRPHMSSSHCVLPPPHMYYWSEKCAAGL